MKLHLSPIQNMEPILFEINMGVIATLVHEVEITMGLPVQFGIHLVFHIKANSVL